MSLNSLKIATDGYLKRQTKAVLIIAVAGYLNFQGTPPIPPNPPSGGGGEGGSYRHERRYEDEQKERRKKIEEDNRFIIEFLKTATDIINNQ